MITSAPSEDGWVKWQPIPGTLTMTDYENLEKRFGVTLPPSFIEWHRSFYFLDGDCGIIRLPESNPAQPLKELIVNFDWEIGRELIAEKLYPFGEEGNDAGPLVFDGRTLVPGNEFPIRIYDQEEGNPPEGLSEIIFSSFPKLLECITYFLEQRAHKETAEIIPAFFDIDPTGAGGPGRTYWEAWV
ncbi:hypothetical protein [Deminuibacter soli]|nr:hypothetical protein [Deminuibacter soli]